MFKVPGNLVVLLKRICIILLLYTLSRLLFFIFNHSAFSEAPALYIIKLFIYGLRFDFCAIALTNALFIILHLWPGKAFYTRTYQAILKILFYAVNIPAILFNAVDFIYFKFTNKRTTADFFQLFTLGEDMKNTIPQIIADFWYVLLIIILLFVLGAWLYNRIRVAYDKSAGLLRGLAFALPVVALSVIAARGGLQYIPVNILSASHYATPQFTPLVLNTPFTIVKTFSKSELEIKNYYTEDELERMFSTRREYTSDGFKPYNVVVIIMESFSKEYVGSLNNNTGYTPFLDSLLQQGLSFNSAFANSKKSMEGIPAILASLPQLMTNPYLTSAYNGNEISTLASHLNKKNYETWFYHGGINGTMGFDRFAKMGGFEHYAGRNEYPVADDFDGNWGIYDEPFFNYFANSLDRSARPFMAAFFSLSSHHPYSIPDSLKQRFRKGTLPIHESIMYADHSLRRFFEKASGKDWFDQTLFVITADHTGPASEPFYHTKAGMYAVPLLFYMPGKIAAGKSDITVQHADIMPSVLDFTGYDMPFNSFGSSVFDSTESHMAFHYIDQIYQLIHDGYLLQFDGTDATGLYHYPFDSTLSNNVISANPDVAGTMTGKLKAVIQQYNNRMITNKLVKP